MGLGSVGSLVAEALARTGVRSITYIDFDRVETRNLDRTLGATAADVGARTLKADLAARAGSASATATSPVLMPVPETLLSEAGLRAALDCDVLFSCVDRPLPRHVLNALAYGHLVPVIDGGIRVLVRDDGRPRIATWRVHAVGPERPCLVCIDALRRSDIALDRDGLLDDPDYIAGLGPAARAVVGRRNVFAFSMSVAAHAVIQFAGIVSGSPAIGGNGAQTYNAYPGTMTVASRGDCDEGCEYAALTGTAPELRGNFPSGIVGRMSGADPR